MASTAQSRQAPEVEGLSQLLRKELEGNANFFFIQSTEPSDALAQSSNDKDRVKTAQRDDSARQPTQGIVSLLKEQLENKSNVLLYQPGDKQKDNNKSDAKNKASNENGK